MTSVIQTSPGRPGRTIRQFRTDRPPMALAPTLTVVLAMAGLQQVPLRAPPAVRARCAGPTMTRTACRPAGTMRRTAATRPAVRATGAGEPTMTRTAIPATRGRATPATGVTVRLDTAVTLTPDTGGRTSPEMTISPGGSAAGCVITVLALKLAMRRMTAGLPVHRATVIAATRAAAAGRAATDLMAMQATDLMAMRATVTRAALAAAAISTAGPRPATGAAQGSLKTGRLRCQVLTTETWAVAAVLAGRTVLAGQGVPGGVAAARGPGAADRGPAAARAQPRPPGPPPATPSPPPGAP